MIQPCSGAVPEPRHATGSIRRDESTRCGKERQNDSVGSSMKWEGGIKKGGRIQPQCKQ